MTFAAYSHYYDLLYYDKDYNAETHYIKSLLSRFSPRSHSLLELGCGTGRHAELLAHAGFDVTGVELSDSMLSQAQRRATEMKASSSGGHFTAVQGDARSFVANRSFDSVISLFHVVSYQTTNEDVNELFSTVSQHLKPNGVFIFDVWYGPAVLSMRPTVRVKRMEDGTTQVLRIAEPSIDVNRNVVDVQYTALVVEKAGGERKTIVERHPMRYFFRPEVELFATLHGMSLVHSEEWMTRAEPSDSTWGVVFVFRKADCPNANKND